MKNIFKKIYTLVRQAKKTSRSQQHNTSSLLNKEIPVKEKQIVDEVWDREPVVAPSHYYVTREGQMIRKPERKTYYLKHRYKFIKRTK